ncbi:flavodoxin domain-containing protein [Microtetraspora sp. NBRC 16547]|uniref:flavodoxin domain-containing protein n=1 Tax=Microtetraspora sp. NBRC 16547 TaxID=3030993 RepID=UPI0024A47BA3|nr:flavodoxin domain-containing protein [Microtetraspora sp. NBRC 16547]GLX01922.1 flavodoxin [Microtetraspora sp. NBRC 16547]
MARVLVAYGSTRGSTAEIAEWIGRALREEGHQVDVVAAGDAADVRAYDVVILGGAVYARRWHKDARRFARRHAATLRALSVWLFSSGPLDHSAVEREIPPTPNVTRWCARLEVLGHVTFGGRLASDAKGFPASTMARSMAGDFRNPAHVTAWAKAVARELG